MPGLPKLLLIVLVLLAAWFAVRWLNKPPPRAAASAARRRRPAAAAPAQPAIEAEDLVACGVCGAYVAATARRCVRADCPRPR